MSVEMIELDNLLELECEAGIRHMLAERNAVGVVTSMTIQTADVFIAIRHAVIGTERHIETSTNQSNVTDTTIPRSGYRINNNIQQSYYFFFIYHLFFVLFWFSNSQFSYLMVGWKWFSRWVIVSRNRLQRVRVNPSSVVATSDV